jgi:hypothetical protein
MQLSEQKLVINLIDILILMNLGFIIFRVATFNIPVPSQSYSKGLYLLISYEVFLVAAFIIFGYQSINLGYTIQEIQPVNKVINSIPFEFVRIFSLCLGLLSCLLVFIVLILLIKFNVQV